MTKITKLLAGACLFAAPMAAAPAGAATIILNDIGGVAGSPAERGFAAAAQYWSRVLTDNVVLRFNVGFSALGDGILGGANARAFVTSATNYYGALNADRTSALDNIAVANLDPLTGGALTVEMPGYVSGNLGVNTATGRTDADGSANNRSIVGASANLKALGFGLPGAPTDADGTIQFSNRVAFDFDPTDGITAGSSDFIGVAIHEIGHALGYISGVDDLDFLGAPDGDGEAQGNTLAVDNFAIGWVMDLYRYSSQGTLNWRPDQEAYFSINNGATDFFGDSNMSTGQFNGDGFQASHWKAPTNAQGQNICNNFIGIMNPYLCRGVGATVTASDLGVFDALGYNINFDVLANPNYRYTSAQAFRDAVPEPATWAMMIVGFMGIGGALRASRRTTKVSFA